MPIVLPQLPRRSAGMTDNIGINCTDWLDGASFTGTPTAVEQTTSDLTITAVAVSTATLTIEGESVAAGKALQAQVAGGTVGTIYDILFTCSTDEADPRTWEKIARHEVL